MLILLVLMCGMAIAQPFNPPVEFTEEDGIPSTYPYKVKFTNGKVTDNLDGTTSIDLTGDLTATSAPVTYYVATTGNDVTGTGTALLPFATLQHAIDTLPAIINHVCYINIAAGTYNESNIVINKLNTEINSTYPFIQYVYITGTVTELLAEQTAEGGSRTTITDTGAFAGVNYAGKFVQLLAGPNYIDPVTYPQFNNYYPIRSNTDDVLTLGCKLTSLLTAATRYRIVENATIIRGDGTTADYGFVNYSAKSLDVHVRNLQFTRAYYGVNNFGKAWVQGCSFVYNTVGYSGVYGNVSSYTIADGNYITGNWQNGGLALNMGNLFYSRWNYIYNGISGLENDSGNYLFSVGCVIDTMSSYGYNSINSGVIKGSDNINYGKEISNCATQAFYAVGGGRINDYMGTGAGNASVARTIGASSVIYNSTRIADTPNFVFDDACGTVTDRGTGYMYMAGDTINWEATNDANPQYRLGASDAEEFHIQSVFDAGAQTLDYVLFQTDTADAGADEGRYVFNVDGTNIVTIDDGGIELGANNLDTTGTITGVNITSGADPGHTHSAYLALDQTTPQEIINGFPTYEDGHAEFTDQHCLVDKEYVDAAVATIGTRFYMLDAADAGIPAYKQTSLTASADATANVSASVNAETDTLIEEWVSPSTMTFSSLEAGVYQLDAYAERTAGNRTVRVFWRFYEYKADTSEVLIATSNLSDIVTSKENIRVYAALSSDYTPDVGSRLVGKVYFNTVGGSQNTTCVIYYRGDEDSHWQTPASEEFLEDNFLMLNCSNDPLTGGFEVDLPAAEGVVIDGTTTPTTVDTFVVNHTTATDNASAVTINAENTHTTGIMSIGIDTNVVHDKVVTGTNGSLIGHIITIAKTGADTSVDTYSIDGFYVTAGNTGSTDAGTKTTRAGYFQAVGDTAGTSTTYGIYATATGADTNYAGYFNGLVAIANGSTSAGVLAIYEDSDDGSNYASFTVPALAANTVYTLPADDGDANDVLSTNGSGTLDWVAGGDITSIGDVSSGAAFDGTQGTTLTFNNIGGDATLDYDGTDFTFSHPITTTTVDTGQGANELYDMNQNVLTTSAVTFTTVDTGQGANELYDMNQNVLTTSSPTFAGETISGGNGSLLTIGVNSEEITVPALGNSATSAGNMWPAGSEILCVAFYTTDGCAGPALTVDLGTAGTSNLFINAEAVSTTGNSGNMYESTYNDWKHRTSFFMQTAGTMRVALSSVTPVGDGLTIRVVVWYRQCTAPTS